MNCYDCPPDRQRTAVAVCHRCHAGVCSEHVYERKSSVHEVHGTGLATQHRPARLLSCEVCHAAEE